MSIEKGINKYVETQDYSEAKRLFSELIQPGQYVGELYSINYETARVLINDHERHIVNGIPSLCFLLATRVDPSNDEIDFKNEDSSAIILRVLDSAPLPNSSEAERIRVETAQRVSGEIATNWDSDGVMDAKTKVYLGYAAVECRIIGTFYFDKNDVSGSLDMKFGCDISNYYPNRGLKVYKPIGNALAKIINYVDPVNLADHEEKYGGKTQPVKIGAVRYASTNRKYQNIDDVPVYIHPIDLLSQKTALFGMTRTGKSNTTKIIARSIYRLRIPCEGYMSARIGQLIFDPNGEYANENTQDSSGTSIPNALKNVWKELSGVKVENEVVTYGIAPVDNDPLRKMMLINFYDDEMLQTGKEIINSLIQPGAAQYMLNFRGVSFDDRPEATEIGLTIRFRRRVIAYKAILKIAGYTPPSSQVSLSGLFSKKITTAMGTATYSNDRGKTEKIRSASATLSKDTVSWDALGSALEGLLYFLSTNDYHSFNNDYIKDSSSGENWADVDLTNILGMFMYQKGMKTLGQCAVQHSANVSSDFADDIYADLKDGKLVIIDQSVGEPEFNETVAKRVMWKIFRNNQAVFREANYPPDILVYVEEAHNLLPAGNDFDLKDIWVRTAKEGAKYRIGLVYATQEVSSIHKNILKNTSNWFISHLNNTDETRELCKFYDFADFEPSIRRAQDKGFLRVKTLSNYFVIPVQVDKFTIEK